MIEYVYVVMSWNEYEGYEEPISFFFKNEEEKSIKCLMDQVQTWKDKDFKGSSGVSIFRVFNSDKKSELVFDTQVNAREIINYRRKNIFPKFKN